MRKQLMMFSLAVSIMLGSAVSAYAEEEMGTRNWKDWDVTIGVGAEYEPVFPGIDEPEWGVLPFIDIEYKDRYFINDRGIGAYILRSQNDPEYGMGISLNYNWDDARDEADARKQLDGLGDIDASLEAKIFFEAEAGPVDLELEIAKGFNSDGHNGVYAEFSAGVGVPITDRFFVEVAPFITYADENYTQSYYGITSQQAARSSTYSSEYNADGGFGSYGLEVSAHYKLSQNWSLIGMAEYTRLMGDAKDSPIVDKEGSFGVITGLAYTF